MKICVGCEKEFEGKRKHAIYCSEACGNRVRVARFNPSEESKLNKLKLQRERRSTKLGKYRAHKEQAARRGIEFKLTFEEWWDIWEPHWCDKLQGKVCMCRTKDQGAYEIGNVRIDTWGNNIREAHNLPLLDTLTLKPMDGLGPQQEYTVVL